MDFVLFFAEAEAVRVGADGGGGAAIATRSSFRTLERPRRHSHPLRLVSPAPERSLQQAAEVADQRRRDHKGQELREYDKSGNLLYPENI